MEWCNKSSGYIYALFYMVGLEVLMLDVLSFQQKKKTEQNTKLTVAASALHPYSQKYGYTHIGSNCCICNAKRVPCIYTLFSIPRESASALFIREYSIYTHQLILHVVSYISCLLILLLLPQPMPWFFFDAPTPPIRFQRIFFFFFLVSFMKKWSFLLYQFPASIRCQLVNVYSDGEMLGVSCLLNLFTSDDECRNRFLEIWTNKTKWKEMSAILHRSNSCDW